jgi:hypothetical protein
MKKLALLTALLAITLSTTAWPAPPEYQVQRATGKITIDGVLDEADWAAAKPVGDFVFPWWTEGEKEQTQVKLLWDDTFIYLAYVCQDIGKDAQPRALCCRHMQPALRHQAKEAYGL